MIAAIFLDRDGTLNVERADYVKSVDEFQLLPGALAALVRLASYAVPVIVITNQSAIGRGIVDRTTIDALHRQFAGQVRAAGGRIDAFYLCPHHPDADCGCRKPQPGLLLAAAADFRVDLAAAVFIGDSIGDLGAARAAGCQPVMVRTGRQRSQLDRLAANDPSMILVDDLGAAVEWIDGRRQR